MRMTPSQYLSDICAPNVAELVKEPTSTQRAWNATVALYHFADYLAADRAAQSGGTLSKHACFDKALAEVISGFPRFQAVRDIANTEKHFRLDWKSPRQGLSVSDLGVGPGAAFTDGTYFDDDTSFDDHGNVVRVEFNGEIIDVVQLCQDCLLHLQAMRA